MARGGSRPGAGRKPKDRTPDGFFEDAQSYLEAVVQGRVEPDALRIAAAKTLIAYERSRTRGPKPSPPPAELSRKSAAAEDREIALDFEEKAKIIRAKHAARRTQK